MLRVPQLLVGSIFGPWCQCRGKSAGSGVVAGQVDITSPLCKEESHDI